MRLVIQRVRSARVVSDGVETGRIGAGLLVLVGVAAGDGALAGELQGLSQAEWLAKKTAAMRIFADEAGLMNRSVGEVGGDVLVVSQFTLFAQTRKGNRPSFIDAARPEEAIPIYNRYVEALRQALPGARVPTGVFGADMQIALEADGPVTIIIDGVDRVAQGIRV